jgi:hypothetical protein
LQDLATTLNKSINEYKKEEDPEEPKATAESAKPNNPDPIDRKCCCVIY